MNEKERLKYIKLILENSINRFEMKEDLINLINVIFKSLKNELNKEFKK